MALLVPRPQSFDPWGFLVASCLLTHPDSWRFKLRYGTRRASWMFWGAPWFTRAQGKKKNVESKTAGVPWSDLRRWRTWVATLDYEKPSRLYLHIISCFDIPSGKLM